MDLYDVDNEIKTIKTTMKEMTNKVKVYYLLERIRNMMKQINELKNNSNSSL